MDSCTSPTRFQHAKASKSAVFNESTGSWESALRSNAKSQTGIIEWRGGVNHLPPHQKAISELWLPTKHCSTWTLNDAIATTYTRLKCRRRVEMMKWLTSIHEHLPFMSFKSCISSGNYGWLGHFGATNINVSHDGEKNSGQYVFECVR